MLPILKAIILKLFFKFLIFFNIMILQKWACYGENFKHR